MALLAEWLLPNLEICGSNPFFGKFNKLVIPNLLRMEKRKLNNLGILLAKVVEHLLVIYLF